MSSFVIKSSHLVHEAGTKDYDVWIIKGIDSNSAMFIKRWGPVGKTGQFQRKTGTLREMDRLYQKTLNDRHKKAYEEKKSADEHFTNVYNDDVQKILYKAWRRYEASIMSFITSAGGEVNAHSDDEETETQSMKSVMPKPEESYSDWGMF